MAIGCVWIVWGSTYAGMRYAVMTIPPFAMAAVRFTLAGALLYAVCVLRGRGKIDRTDVVRACVTGTTLLLLGNGITAYTVEFLPTGINALLLSSSAIWMAAIAYAWGGERPPVIALAGMVLGLGGVSLLVQPHVAGGLPIVPTCLALGASVAWAAGSVYVRRVGKPADPLLATGLQMIAGGVLIGIEAAFFGQWRALHLGAVSTASWLALAWLVVFGSIVGYSAYQYTMHAANAVLATTYAYINPIVSVLLGFCLFGERLSTVQTAAAVVIVAGVALMMWPAPRAVGAHDGRAEGHLTVKP